MWHLGLPDCHLTLGQATDRQWQQRQRTRKDRQGDDFAGSGRYDHRLEIHNVRVCNFEAILDFLHLADERAWGDDAD